MMRFHGGGGGVGAGGERIEKYERFEREMQERGGKFKIIFSLGSNQSEAGGRQWIRSDFERIGISCESIWDWVPLDCILLKNRRLCRNFQVNSVCSWHQKSEFSWMSSIKPDKIEMFPKAFSVENWETSRMFLWIQFVTVFVYRKWFTCRYNATSSRGSV